MRRYVSVTDLADFATCETRHILRQQYGDRATREDLDRRARGNRIHADQDHWVRSFGSTIKGVLTVVRRAFWAGIPLTAFGLFMKASAVNSLAAMVIENTVIGAGDLALLMVRDEDGVLARILYFSLGQVLYFMILSAIVHRFFVRTETT